jgi:AraC-like DNA-binding protein
VQASSDSIRFSTAELPDRERLPVWREVFGRQVVKVDMEPIGDAPFHSDADIRLLPGLSISSNRISANRIKRTPQLVADGSDDFILALMARGQATASQGGREASFGAGEAILWSNARTGTCYYPDPIEFVALTIPRLSLAASVANIDRALVTTIPRANGALALLIRYLAILRPELGTQPPELQVLSATHIQDLAVLAVGATRDATETAKGRGIRAARLRAVEADVIANIASRDLSIDTVAVRHGVSPRYIRSLFQDAHSSFTDFVLKQRLARAHRRLLDPRFTDRMISTIAFECGFGDLSYFNHAFRRQYGATPSDVRMMARKAK